MTGLLAVLVAIAAVQLLLGVLAIVAGLDYARRATDILRSIDARAEASSAALRALQTHAEVDSNETLPAIRGAVSDVVHALVPPGGAR